MKVLQLTVHYPPNIGGVETHLSDLVSSLTKRKYRVFVLTYRPLEVKAFWKMFERKERLSILRLPWLPGFFYKLSEKPILEFLYLMPGIFMMTPFVLLLENPEVIQAHGIISSFAGVFWGKIFRKRIIATTHSIYHFPSKGIYRSFAYWIFKSCDCVLTLSKQSKKEIENLGIKPNKVKVFTYWLDLSKFKVQSSKFKVRKKLGLRKDAFIVLFVGRLIAEKGISELLESSKKWNRNIYLVVAGSGPMEARIKSQELRIRNIKFLGRLDNSDLPKYYSAADLTIVPSTHEEGFGRVILESLACGTPVIAARRGAIPEAMDESVGRLIEISPRNIKKTVEELYEDKKELEGLAINARKFAEIRYSINNVQKIINSYYK